MTTKLSVTDAALETMLARRAHRADPAGLADAVFAAIDATPQGRGPRLGVPAWWLPGRPSRGLAWVLVAASLMLALLASALVVGSLPGPRPPIALVPTGLDVVAPQSAAPDRVVLDGTGTLWAVGFGRVTRFDPATGAHRTWTLSDDASFASLTMAPARAGGVWIWSGTRILRFTGDGFAESITASTTSGVDLAEAEDGSLWATSYERGLEHWDGSTWIPEPAGRPTVEAYSLLLAADGDVWVVNPSAGVGEEGVFGRGLSHLDEGRWVTYDAHRAPDEPTPGGMVAAIEEAGDGSIWVASGCEHGACSISRFDGRSWSAVDGPSFSVGSLEAAFDGSIWAVASGGATPAVARFAGGRWTSFGAGLGLDGAVLGHVSATSAGVFLGTDAGPMRFVDERWVPVWPGADDAPRFDSIAEHLVAVSADEAWATDERGIWHYLDGAWVGPMEPAGWSAPTHDLALGLDGTLWAATDSGVAALRDGRWTVASTGAARSIAIAQDGTAWAGSAAIQSIVGLRLDGSPPQTVYCPNGSWAIAATADGSVFVGQFSFSGRPGLARFDGRTCESVDPIADGLGVEVVDLVADPGGGIIAAMFRGPTSTQGAGNVYANYLARYDGSRWTLLDEFDYPFAHGLGDTMAASGDQVWRVGRAADVALERFDGDRWVPVITGFRVLGPLSIARDGTIWFAGLRLRAEDVRP
jgi:hypothetical protein